MADGFNDYIRQLQELENAESVASLKALRKMNEEVLSFFPSILEKIDYLIASDSVSLDIIDEIKKHLTSLSNCKRYISRLSSSEKSKFYANEIATLVYQRHSLTMYEADTYEGELLEMIRQNDIKLKEEYDIAEAEMKEKEKAERNAQIEAERKAEIAKMKEPKQYLCISISDISADEDIDVFVDGVKDSSYHANRDILHVSGAVWGVSIEMSNAEHLVSLLFQLARIKLEMTIPKIDFRKEGSEMNTICYLISSSSLIKKWTSDPSKIYVKAWLEDPNSWFGGSKRFHADYMITKL